MKIHTRVLLLGVIAACALSAAGSASAAQWHISGTTFSGTETVSSKIKTGTTMVLTSTLPGGAKVLIACKGISTNKGLIFLNNKDSVESILFKECSVSEPINCKLSPSEEKEIITNPLLTEISTDGALVFDRFTPLTGVTGEFVPISLLGSSCEGLYKLTGTANGLVIAPDTESVEKEIQFSSTTGSTLKLGAQAATLTGTAVYSLSGTRKGLVWSAKTS